MGEGKTVSSFANFALSETRELDDGVGLNGINIYHKSLLYLVSRALERQEQGAIGAFEVPLLGMQRFFDQPFGSDTTITLQEAIQAAGGSALFSRTLAPPNCRTDSRSHGDFDNDSPTMTSVLLRILGQDTPTRENDFQEDIALIDADRAPVTAAERPSQPEAQPIMFAAGVQSPGEEPLVDTAEPQAQRPTVPAPSEGLIPEVAEAPVSGAPITDVLYAYGRWKEKPKNEQPERAQSNPDRKKKKGKSGRKNSSK
jgi:hypothetical protein